VLIAAAVCPHPPLLMPQVAQRAASELAELRAACDRAVSGLSASGSDVVAVVGCGTADREHGADAAGDLRGYGVPAGAGAGEPELPLSLTVGRWLCERAGLRPQRYVEVDPAAASADCGERGAALAATAQRVALLVMGDGSARRGEHAPGYPDERAAAFDSAVARALAEADSDALAGVDPEPAAELMVQGRAAWQASARQAQPLTRAGPLRSSAGAAAPARSPGSNRRTRAPTRSPLGAAL